MKRDRVKGARRPFSVDLLADLLAAFRRDEPDLFPLALLLSETGLRLGDGARLAWQAVDLPGALVSVRISKTGDLVEIPIQGELLALLAKTPRSAGFVWPDLADLYEKRPRDYSRRLKRLLRKLGLEPRVKLPGRTRPLSVWNWHSFRHSFVKRLATSKVANSVIMSMTGHKSPDLVLHYSQEVSLEEKRAAILAAKLPKLP
jgi:integrase